MSRWMIALGLVVTLLMLTGGAVSAQQAVPTAVQINNAENGFLGGDMLHCSPDGCVLRNKDGIELGHYDNRLLDTYWNGKLIGDIDYALALCARDARNHSMRFKTNTTYYSNKKFSMDTSLPMGTYGPLSLWAVYNGPNATPTCSLQLNGYTEPGKPVQFTFTTNTDGTFNSLPVPAKDAPAPQNGFPGFG